MVFYCFPSSSILVNRPPVKNKLTIRGQNPVKKNRLPSIPIVKKFQDKTLFFVLGITSKINIIPPWSFVKKTMGRKIKLVSLIHLAWEEHEK